MDRRMDRYSSAHPINPLTVSYEHKGYVYGGEVQRGGEGEREKRQKERASAHDSQVISRIAEEAEQAI
jgi:hypothetical protein